MPLVHCTANVVKEPVVSSDSIKTYTKDNWHLSANHQPILEPTEPCPSPGFEGENCIEDESGIGSVVDSEDWIGEDDRASNATSPSVSQELDFQRHDLLMQQPPRGSPTVYF